jgi:hypothetical protein
MVLSSSFQQTKDLPSLASLRNANEKSLNFRENIFKSRWAWWSTPVIPALGRQEGSRVGGLPGLPSEFKVSLGYMRPCLKKTRVGI